MCYNKLCTITYNIYIAISCSNPLLHGMVYIRTTGSTSTSRELRGTVRESSTGLSFTFQSDAIDVAGTRWLHLYLHVPYNWEYSITTAGGSTDANIDKWYEMY